MKKILQIICGLVLSSTSFCCSKEQRAEQQNIKTNDITVKSDGIASLIKQIESDLPITIPFSNEDIKSLSWDKTDEVLELFLFIDENVGNDDWYDIDDDQYWGKYHIAEIYSLVNMEKNISKLDEEDREEIKNDDQWEIVTNNRTLFKNLHKLLQCMADDGHKAVIKLRSKDGKGKTIRLSSDEVKDAVVYHEEILEKVDRDHSVDPF